MTPPEESGLRDACERFWLLARLPESPDGANPGPEDHGVAQTPGVQP